MITLLVTVTVFDDRSILAYSVHNFGPDDYGTGGFSPLSQIDAGLEAWAYLMTVMPAIDATRIAVIDRRPGTRATSRSNGVLLTL